MDTFNPEIHRRVAHREVGRGGGGRVRVEEDDATGLFDTGVTRGEVN
jgi:hypothetical protein